MAYKLLYCIPTNGRIDVIEEFIKKYIDDYLNCGIDVMIYDSSCDDATYMLVERYNNDSSSKGNILYRRVDNELSLPMKVYSILNDNSLTDRYDYLWLSNDALRFKFKGLKGIVEALEANPDVLILDHLTNGRDMETDVYSERDMFFQECVWLTNLLGSMILNVKSMISNADMGYYEKVYSGPPVENWSINYYCFHRIAQLERFLGMRIYCREERVFSYLKKGNFWRDKVFPLLCEEWPCMINSLPDCYTNKARVCRQSAYDAVLGKISLYFQLRMDGLYNLSTYLKYKDTWSKVSYIPKWQLFLLSLVPKSFFKAYYGLRVYLLDRKISRLCKQGKKIIIYGAGMFANRYIQYLERKRINIEAVCVSSKTHVAEFMGYRVYSYCDLSDEDKKSMGFIVAMGTGFSKDVVRLLRLKVDEEQIVCEPQCELYVSYALGYKYIAGNGWV